jgi:hypothetical protein
MQAPRDVVRCGEESLAGEGLLVLHCDGHPGTMDGRRFISASKLGIPYESPQAAHDWLLNSPSSPWQRIPWNLPLN